jgi:hypothetical protein
VLRGPVSVLAAVLALAGCTRPTPVAVKPVVAVPPAAPVPPASLVGRWRVGAIDGVPAGMVLSINADTIWFEPSCAGFLWRYRYLAGALSTTNPWYDALARGQTPPPLCVAPVLPEQRALALTLGVASRAVRTRANGVELSGGGHTVTLFSY